MHSQPQTVTPTNPFRRRLVSLMRKECATHLAKSDALAPPNCTLTGWDMEAACQGCKHKLETRQPYCRIARVEAGRW